MKNQLLILAIVLLSSVELYSQTFESINRETTYAVGGSSGIEPDSRTWYIADNQVISINGDGNAGDIYDVLDYNVESEMVILLKSSEGKKYTLKISHKESNLYFLTFTPLSDNPSWQDVYLCLVSQEE